MLVILFQIINNVHYQVLIIKVVIFEHKVIIVIRVVRLRMRIVKIIPRVVLVFLFEKIEIKIFVLLQRIEKIKLLTRF